MNLKLIRVNAESPDTKTYFFKPDKTIKYRPGQYYYFTIPTIKYEDKRGNTRHFTISSSPSEGSIISFTTKFPDPLSGFKKTLLELTVGSVIKGDGPQGQFVLPNKPSTTSLNLFIAGGIGITPFRSMIKNNVDKELKTPMYLIYSNSDNHFPFKEELDLWQNQNRHIKIEYFNSHLLGHLDLNKINNILNKWKLDIKNLLVWFVGPPLFVTSMEEIFEDLNIKSDKIISEKFTGY